MTDDLEAMMLKAIRALRAKAEHEGFSDEVQEQHDKLTLAMDKCHEMMQEWRQDMIDRNERELALLTDREIPNISSKSLALH